MRENANRPPCAAGGYAGGDEIAVHMEADTSQETEKKVDTQEKAQVRVTLIISGAKTRETAKAMLSERNAERLMRLLDAMTE